MHNYIINDRVLFNTYTGTLSRLDNPKQLSILSHNAKLLFLRLIDSGYQIVPFEHLATLIEDSSQVNDTNALISQELESITQAFLLVDEYEPILISYFHSVQLSTDVELKVISSYRTFHNDDDKKKPYIAKNSLINSSTAAKNNPISPPKADGSRFIWYYIRIALLATLSIFLFYYVIQLFSPKPDYFSDYHFQGKSQQCSLFIHSQRPTNLPGLTSRIEELGIDCSEPRDIYVAIPADDRRESYQICKGNPDKDESPCINFYVVKIK